MGDHLGFEPRTSDLKIELSDLHRERLGYLCSEDGALTSELMVCVFHILYGFDINTSGNFEGANFKKPGLESPGCPTNNIYLEINMSTKICEHCSTTMSIKKRRFCSQTCSRAAHKIVMLELGDARRKQNITRYLSHPKTCITCSSVIPYTNRAGKFCSHSCSASYNNSRRPARRKYKAISPKRPGEHKSTSKQPMPAQWQKTCSITGQLFTDINAYRNREWSPYPGGKIRTVRLLAGAFDIKLGVESAPQLLSQAKAQLLYDYSVLKLSTLALHSKYKFSCSASHIGNLLKALGIQRRNLSDACKLAVLEGRATPPHSTQFKSGCYTDWEGRSHTYRSSYELRYYQDLDAAKISYDTESIRVIYYDSQQSCQRVAIPDIIIGNNIIIEIKSYWTYNKQNMIDKYLAYKDRGYAMILCLEFINYIINDIIDFPDDIINGSQLK